VRHLLERHILFFGGKGGVGKTTCAAALALAASRAGKRVLLVSTDPAHSTSDIFETALDATEREILPGLACLELDADAEVRRYLEDARTRMAGAFRPAVVREAARQIELTASMPGVADVAVFDRVADLIVSRAGSYDLVVFDTAPTGHALRLLRLPELMSSWVEALARRRREAVAADNLVRASSGPGPSPADPVLAILEARLARLSEVRLELARGDRVAFVLVLIPERLPIEESIRAAHQLSEAGVTLAGLIVNRVLPDDAPNDYFRARKEQEREHLAEIDRRLPAVRRVFVPQLESDVHGLAGLERVSACLLDERALRR
jgi:arsenite/tail-anchored protein-transporting ATPase